MDLPITQNNNQVSSNTINNENTLELLPTNEEATSNKETTNDNTFTQYEVSNEEIILLQKQIKVDTEKAREILTKYQGDQVEALMELYNTNYQAPPTAGLASSSTKTLELNGMLNENQVNNTSEEALVKYPVIRNVLNTSPEFLEKFKTAYTYLVAPLSLENNGITKFKKYGTLPEVIQEKVLEVVKNNYNILSTNTENPNYIDSDKLKRWRKNKSTLKSIIKTKGQNGNLPELNKINDYLKVETMIKKWEEGDMNIYPLQGNTQELLNKWDMTNAGLVIYQNQIKNKNTFEKNHTAYTFLINNNATELAQQNGVISQEEVVVGHSAIINPCY